MKNIFGDIALYSFIVGGILVLTKPGSHGTAFVRALFGSFTNLVQGATGQQPTKFS